MADDTSRTTVSVPLEPTRIMLRAYHCALRNLIRSIPQEEREARWGRSRKRRGSYVYNVPDDEKAAARYRAMVLAAQEVESTDAKS